jgi:hypothetical protein
VGLEMHRERRTSASQSPARTAMAIDSKENEPFVNFGAFSKR